MAGVAVISIAVLIASRLLVFVEMASSKPLKAATTET
jgi:hypothetical protein